MLILGDILAIVAALVGGAISTWAMAMAFPLLFVGRVSAAEMRITTAPWKTFFLGLLLATFFTTIAVVLAAIPNPLMKFAGTALFLAILAVAMLGFSGLALGTSRRIQMLDSSVPPFKNLCRATALLVIASFLPFLGWFLVAPVLLILGFGAGMQAILGVAPATANESRGV